METFTTNLTEDPLGPLLANIFLTHHENIWLDNCPSEFMNIDAMLTIRLSIHESSKIVKYIVKQTN